jgi:hypothetical protein
MRARARTHTRVTIHEGEVYFRVDKSQIKMFLICQTEQQQNDTAFCLPGLRANLPNRNPISLPIFAKIKITVRKKSCLKYLRTTDRVSERERGEIKKKRLPRVELSHFSFLHSRITKSGVT